MAVEQITGQPVLQIQVKQDEIARYGIPAKAVLDLVESVGSKPLGEVVEGQLRFPLVVRLPEKYRASPEAIGGDPGGRPVGRTHPAVPAGDGGGRGRPVHHHARVGPAADHRDLQRAGPRPGQLRGGGPAAGRREGADAAQGRYHVEWGGQFENLQRARTRLLIVVPLAVVLIFGLLYLTYHNVVDALRVFTGVPFAWVGGIFALWLRDMPFSISAAIGFIALSGVAVLDDMILVSYVRQLRRQGRAAGRGGSAGGDDPAAARC